MKKNAFLAAALSVVASVSFAKNPLMSFPVVFDSHLGAYPLSVVFKTSLKPLGDKSTQRIGRNSHGAVFTTHQSMGTVAIVNRNGTDYVCENSTAPAVNQIFVSRQHGLLTCKYQVA